MMTTSTTTFPARFSRIFKLCWTTTALLVLLSQLLPTSTYAEESVSCAMSHWRVSSCINQTSVVAVDVSPGCDFVVSVKWGDGVQTNKYYNHSLVDTWDGDDKTTVTDFSFLVTVEQEYVYGRVGTFDVQVHVMMYQPGTTVSTIPEIPVNSPVLARLYVEENTCRIQEAPGADSAAPAVWPNYIAGMLLALFVPFAFCG